MIKFLTNHLKLKTRLAIGYVFSGLMALLIIAITYITFTNTTENFKRFISINQQAQSNLLLAKNTSEMQRYVLSYIYQGYDSAAESVKQSYQRLIHSLDKDVDEQDPQTKKIIQLIENHLTTYHSAFLQVIKQRELREKLINVDFRKQAANLEKLLNQCLELNIENTKEANILRLTLYKTLNSVLLIERNASQYFKTLDASFIKFAQQNLSTTRITIKKLIKQTYNFNQFRKFDQLLIAIDLYEKSFLEAVQRTRGYLYLINVVMAAEAYEIIYQSQQLTQLASTQMNQIEEHIIIDIADAIMMIFIIGSILLLIIFTFVYGVGQSITRPIEKLTATFMQLAKGSKEAKIPPYLLNDEVGELTHAAETFREKNIQTEKLLQQSTQLTNELTHSKQQLEHSNDELEQFVYTVSHDLKSPLVTSMGFIGIIKKLSEQGKYEQAIGKLDKVVNANERMSQLINDLLELSRVGRIDLETSYVDLNKLLANISQMKHELDQDSQFTLKILPDLPVLEANESRIMQIFENIISNAKKYASNENGGLLEIGSKETDDADLIYCRDNGPGIPEEFQKKIFALFYRLDDTHEGTGIGLAIIKKLMRLYNGSIWIESELGKGTTFWLKFPKKTEDKKGNSNVC